MTNTATDAGGGQWRWIPGPDWYGCTECGSKIDTFRDAHFNHHEHCEWFQARFTYKGNTTMKKTLTALALTAGILTATAGAAQLADARPPIPAEQCACMFKTWSPIGPKQTFIFW